MFLLLCPFNFQVYTRRWHKKGKVSLNVTIDFLKISNQKTKMRETEKEMLLMEKLHKLTHRTGHKRIQ